MQRRTFTLEDQISFSRLSGDNNPLHVDPIAARRYLFGQPVVHGMHSVLWALDDWLAGQTAAVNLRSLKVHFLKPVLLGTEVRCVSAYEQSHRVRLEVLGSGAAATRIQAQWDAGPPAGADPPEPRFPEPRSPRDLSEDEIEKAAGRLNLYLHREAALALFPNLLHCLPPAQLAVLLATTRLVGVECPGLHSVYSELELSADDCRRGDALHYAVEKLDRSFHLASLRLAGPGMTGAIKAFVRPAPRPQPGYLELKREVAGGEFAGQSALVVGGSRGLGEVAAKLLCAGGARVKITYHQGREDARRVVDEIVAHGGAASCARFDVLQPDGDPADGAPADRPPSHLYYFATPFISPGEWGSFSADLFHKFCAYYVAGFARTVERLRTLGLKNVFYPSTAYVDELPWNMGEYAAAKTAGETMCRLLEKKHPEMKIHRPRLPRMATDQTAGLLPVRNQEPVPVLVKALRSFLGKAVIVQLALLELFSAVAGQV